MVLRHLIAGLAVGLTAALLFASMTQINLIWLIVIGIATANLGAVASVLIDNIRPRQRHDKAHPLPRSAHHPKR